MSRFKTYAFWVALSSAIVILIQNIGKLFGFEIESGIIENLIMSICGVLVVLGIVSKGNNTDNQEVQNNDLNIIEEESEDVLQEKDIYDDEIISTNENNDGFNGFDE